MNPDDARLLQRQVAQLSANGSSLRNQGAPGVVAAARKELAEVNLLLLPRAGSDEFTRRLDDITQNLLCSFPAGAQHWGAARKVLNHSLRDCLYNFYLRDWYGLAVCEPFLELPLDSYVAKGLHETERGDDLPKWCGVKYVTSEVNALYQEVASEEAERLGIERVHLDLRYWQPAQ